MSTTAATPSPRQVIDYVTRLWEIECSWLLGELSFAEYRLQLKAAASAGAPAPALAARGGEAP